MQESKMHTQSGTETRTYRTRQETVAYLNHLSYHFSVIAHRENDLVAKGKAEAYENAAFEVERNMKD